MIEVTAEQFAKHPWMQSHVYAVNAFSADQVSAYASDPGALARATGGHAPILLEDYPGVLTECGHA